MGTHPFLSIGLFPILGVFGVLFINIILLRVEIMYTNNVQPDQTPRCAVSIICGYTVCLCLLYERLGTSKLSHFSACVVNRLLLENRKSIPIILMVKKTF